MSGFNTLNVGMLGVGILLIISALRGDSPAAVVGPIIGRNDIPKGTLKVTKTTGNTAVDSGTGSSNQGTANSTGANGSTKTTTPPPKPAAPTPPPKPAAPTKSTMSMSPGQVIVSN